MHRDQWIKNVCKVMSDVIELCDVADAYGDRDTIHQEWFMSLLLRLAEDAVRLGAAVSSTDASHLGVDSQVLC